MRERAAERFGSPRHQLAAGGPVGAARSRICFFMNKFCTLGFIAYDRELIVHASLLRVVAGDASSQIGRVPHSSSAALRARAEADA